jgi:hypothetical protein
MVQNFETFEERVTFIKRVLTKGPGSRRTRAKCLVLGRIALPWFGYKVCSGRVLFGERCFICSTRAHEKKW